MPANFSDGFQSSARSELARLESELVTVDNQLKGMTARRAHLVAQVSHLRVLLGQPPHPATPPLSGPALTTNSRGDRRARGASRDADRVVALLRRKNSPMHYREIYEALSAEPKGLNAGGKDPANTLLARFFDDPRLYRPSRGTYGLKEWEGAAS